MPERAITRPTAYRLISVRTISFQEQLQPDELDRESSLLVHKYTGSVGFNDESGEMRIRMLLTAAIQDKNTDEEEPYVLVECATETDFEFEFPEGCVNDQHRMIDFNLVANVFGISYSTSRGILIGKSQLTNLSKYPPVMISPVKEIQKLDAPWIIPLNIPDGDSKEG